jgi:membrane protease YdiL (CAAX protease family)
MENQMNSIPSFIKRYPQGVFWGIAWATSFFGYFMSVMYPSDLWLLFILGPFVGGVLVTAIADGRSGLKTFFSRIVRWRVGIQWYAVALFLPLILRLVAFGLNIISGATVPTSIQWSSWTGLLLETFIFSMIIAIGEEPGFRGFALPRLLTSRSALAASLILGVLHTVWHLPLLISGDEPLMIIPIILSGAIINTWLFNHTNGSVFIAILLHASVDLWAGIFNPLFSPADAARQEIWLMLAYVVMALLLTILTGKELGRKPHAALDTMAAERSLASD